MLVTDNRIGIAAYSCEWAQKKDGKSISDMRRRQFITLFGAAVTWPLEQGVFVGKILQGAKPTGMPVEQPTQIMMKVNLKAVTALGIKIPPVQLARADEVIE